MEEVVAGALGKEALWKNELAAFLSVWCGLQDFVEVHTSGSTGHPKRICLSKAAMSASARLTNDFFGITEHSMLLLSLPVSYIAGKMMAVRAFIAGASLVVEPPSALPLSVDYPEIALGALVPLQVEELLSSGESRRFASIRNLLVGGAPLALRTRALLSPLATRFYATYGMTETASHVALMQLNGKEASTCFEALGEVHFRTDTSGCLCIYAPHIAETEIFTHDIAELIDERHFIWKGRSDYVINSGGIKFSPEELENILAQELDTPFYITSLPDKRLGERIVIVVEGPEWDLEKCKRMDAIFRNLLPAYAFPREIIYTEHIPRTSSGKLIRSRSVLTDTNLPKPT